MCRRHFIPLELLQWKYKLEFSASLYSSQKTNKIHNLQMRPWSWDRSAMNDITCHESFRHSHVGAPEASTSSSLQDAATACRTQQQQQQQGNRDWESFCSPWNKHSADPWKLFLTRCSCRQPSAGCPGWAPSGLCSVGTGVSDLFQSCGEKTEASLSVSIRLDLDSLFVSFSVCHRV